MPFPFAWLEIATGSASIYQSFYFVDFFFFCIYFLNNILHFIDPFILTIPKMLYKFNELICKLHTGIIHPPLQCNQHSSSLRIKILLGNHEFEATTVWKRYVQMYLRRGAKTLSAVAMRWFVSTKVHRLIILGLILTIQIYRPFVESQQILTETAAVH